jgi:hypothetical protein
MDTKRLELLRGLLPTAAVIGVLLNPSNPSHEILSGDIQVAASGLGQPSSCLECQNGARSRHGVCKPTPAARRGTRRFQRAAFYDAPRKDCCAGRTPQDSDDLPLARVYRRWRFDQLWSQHHICLPTNARNLRPRTARAASHPAPPARCACAPIFFRPARSGKNLTAIYIFRARTTATSPQVPAVMHGHQTINTVS